MNALRELQRRIAMLFRRDEFDADLQEEIRLHMDLREQQQVAAGLSPDEARYAAHRKFGNATRLQEDSHLQWGWTWFEDFLQDLHYGLRAMLRSPGVTTVAILSLVLGIGANTSIFSFLDAVLLRSLPVRNPHELVLLGQGLDNGVSDAYANVELYSYPFYRKLQDRTQVFSDVASASSMINKLQATIEGRPSPEPMSIKLVSGTYFPTLGIEPFMGRLLSDDDDRFKDSSPVAVLAYAWWKNSLARDPGVLGKKLTVGSSVFTVVGVAPQDFFGTTVGEAPDVFIPLSMQKEIPPGNDGYADNFAESLHIIGRLKPGVTISQAAANTNLLFQQIIRSFPEIPLNAVNQGKLDRAIVELQPMANGLSRIRYMFSEPLKILMAVVALVLLIACANIANLLLARSTARSRELAMRQPLGARRSRLIRQLLTESLLLAFTGGLLGVLLAAAANRFLLKMISPGTELLPLNVAINPRLLLFTLLVTFATAILFGMLPAFRATGLDLTESLKDGRGSSGSSRKGFLARTLIVSQVALSLVLLVASGLFLRTLINLTNIDTGFNPSHVIRLQTDAASEQYKAGEAPLMRLYQQIDEKVQAIPGVVSSSSSLFTFNGGSWNNSIWVQGYPSGHRDVSVHHNIVGPGYFSTMGIKLIRGRTFDATDTGTSQKVAVISESTARNLFPQGSALGMHFGKHDAGNAGDLEVIGIVGDTKVHSLDEPQQYLTYVPAAQMGWFYLNHFEVRYSGDRQATIAAVRAAIHDVDPHLPLTDIQTLDEQIARSIPMQRLVAQLSTFFGLLAVFLSCIGIYGLMSYMVTRRTNEIGVRMALGAKRSNVLWLVMKESTRLLAAGITVGALAALAGQRFVVALLYGLKPGDPISLLAAVAILTLVAGTAAYLPARRAAQVDPMVALRYE